MSDEYNKGRYLALKQIKEGATAPTDIKASDDFEAGYYSAFYAAVD